MTLANITGATMGLNEFDWAIASLADNNSGGGNVTIGSRLGQPDHQRQQHQHRLRCVISGTGTVTKVGTGTQTLSGTNTYTA